MSAGLGCTPALSVTHNISAAGVCCLWHSFCPFFHVSVTVQKSTQDRTIRAFIPAILLNLSLPHCDSAFCSVILKSLDLRHVNDNSNTN